MADGFAASLTVLVNRALEELAPRGIEGERLRKHVLRLERELRATLAAGGSGTLSDLWAAAAERLASASDESVAKILAAAGKAIKADGELVDCDEALPSRFMIHAWRHVQAQKSALFHGHVDALQRKLSDILRAAFVHSAAGQQPAALEAAMGGMHADDFDFAVMSRLVGKNVPKDELPAARRERIERVLSVLRAQRFHASKLGTEGGTHEFLFDNVAAAVAAYRDRLPQVVELVKAIAIAELETRNGYDEADHDPFFEAYDEHSLSADDFALFPDYLVCIPADRNDAPENAGLMDTLSSGLPVKVVVQVTDLLEEASLGTGHFAFGVRSARLATTAMGLGGMFVLQAAASSLYRMRHRVETGMGVRGPALFSIFAGAPAAAGDLPRYLTAAAAMESRAFPAFVYDAAAGENWATRFSLEPNRNPETDWPVEPFEYADEALQRVRERHRLHLRRLRAVRPPQRRSTSPSCRATAGRPRWCRPPSGWRSPEREAAERVPYLLAVDDKDVLHRVIVDTRMMQATRRCLLLWHRLQEHGGIHDSHAERLLAREKAALGGAEERGDRRDPQGAPAAAGTRRPPRPRRQPRRRRRPRPPKPRPRPRRSSPPTTRGSRRRAARAATSASSSTRRCSSTTTTSRPTSRTSNAGTYRQLVEAAETCQVAIIHPGKPRNPNEPGLDELIKRAEPFQ